MALVPTAGPSSDEQLALWQSNPGLSAPKNWHSYVTFDRELVAGYVRSSHTTVCSSVLRIQDCSPVLTLSILPTQKENRKPDNLPISVGALTSLTDRVGIVSRLVKQLANGTDNLVPITRDDYESALGSEIGLQSDPAAYDTRRLGGQDREAGCARQREKGNYPRRVTSQD